MSPLRRWIGGAMLLVMLTSLALPAAPVRAAGVEELDQIQPQRNASQTCKLDYACVQVFTAGKTGKLSRVRLLADRVSGTGAMLVEVRTLVAGKPIGTTLASAKVTAASVPAHGDPSTPTWLDVTFATPANVVTGEQYGLFVGAETNGVYHWYDDHQEPGPYPGGFEWLQDNKTEWGSFTKWDFAFETYVTPAMDNAQLSALAISAGSLSPAFSSSQKSYSVELANFVTTLRVTPTAADPAATVLVNGGPAGAPVTLHDGNNTISILVTAADGKTTATYTITAHRNALPTISGLAQATIEAGKDTGAIPFTISDLDPGATFSVAASSDNPALVSDSNIFLSGTGKNRAIRVKSNPNVTGEAMIELQVSDGTDVAVIPFMVTILAVNEPPTFDPIPPQTTPGDEALVLDLPITDPDSLPTLNLSAVSSNQTVLPNSALVTAFADGLWRLTITPVVKKVGTTRITVTASEGTESVSQSFDLEILAVDYAPEIEPPKDATIEEDKPSHTVTFKVTDETPERVEVTLTSSNKSLIRDSFTVIRNGSNYTATFAPEKDQYGETIITIHATDGVKSSTATFKVTVAPINDPPEILPVGNRSTAEDTPVTISVTLNDVDDLPENVTLTATSGRTSLVPNGNIELVRTGNPWVWDLTITPAKDQNGTVTITLKANDKKLTTTHTFDLVVTPVNDPPWISPIDDVGIAQGGPAPKVTVTVGDPDTPLGSLVVSATSSNQELVPNTNLAIPATATTASRTLTISPVAGKGGSTTITVRVTDGEFTTETSFVFAVSEPPTISVLPDMTIDEDTVAPTIYFTVGDATKPAADLEVTVSHNNPALIESAILGQVDGSQRTLDIKPRPDANGAATFEVRVSNGTLTAKRSFKLTVRPVNDPPTIKAIEDITTYEDVPVGPILIEIYDPDNDNLILTAVSSNNNLVPNTKANLNIGGVGNTRGLTITPALDQSGVTFITVTVTDGQLSASTTFKLTVIEVDDPAVISAPPTFTMDEDTVGRVLISAYDPDSPIANHTLTATSGNYEVILDSGIRVIRDPLDPGRWTLEITPLPDKSGVVPVKIIVTDGFTTATATMQVVVRDVNDAPVISDIFDQSTNEDTPILGIPFTVWDAETPADKLKVTVNSDNPKLVPRDAFVVEGTGANRTLSIFPAPDQYGTALVTLYVTDGELTTASKPFILTVNSIPDTPEFYGLEDRTIDEDKVLNLPLTLHAPDSDPAKLAIIWASDNQALVRDSDIKLTGTGSKRTLTITPLPDANGVATITVFLNDGVLSNFQAFVLTVNAVNDQPLISIISDRTIFEDQSTGPIPFTISDAETNADHLIVTATSSDKTLVPDENIVIEGTGLNRTITVTPAPDRNGRTSIKVTVSDGELSNYETFLLTVIAVNDPPTFNVGPDIFVDEDTGPHTFKQWAKSISAGPFETGQKLTFEVEYSNPSLFSVPPAVAADGTLTFNTVLHAYGSSNVNVRLKDNGGTANGGHDTSDWQMFVINVASVNDLPVVSEIPDQGTEVGEPTAILPFTVWDVETPEGALWVTARSSNRDLVPDANIIVAGINDQRTVQVVPVPGKIGQTTITLTVHDTDGGKTERSFLVIVNNLWLRDLLPETGVINPRFDSHTLSYTVVYKGTLSEMRVTPFTSDPEVEILVQGMKTPSGRLSAPFPVELAGGQAQIVVWAPRTGITKTYTIRFVRALSQTADLDDIQVRPGTLSPAFHPDTLNYTVTLDNGITEIQVIPKLADGRSVYEMEGKPQLSVGTNRFRITVTAENANQKVYTVNVIRNQPDLAVQDLDIQAGGEWAKLFFTTTTDAAATVTYQAKGGVERTAIASGSVQHEVTLDDLKPFTAYTFKVKASRGTESAEYTSVFTTTGPSPDYLCRGGQIRSDIPYNAVMQCPGSEQVISAITKALDGERVKATAVTESAMREALRLAGAEGVRGKPANVVIEAGGEGTTQAALVEIAAIQRAVNLGSSVEVRSRFGSLTLPRAALTGMLEPANGQLLVRFAEVPSDRDDLRRFTTDSQVVRVSPVVDVTVAILLPDGRLLPQTQFNAPLLLKLNLDRGALAQPHLIGGYWLTEEEERVEGRLYLGGEVDAKAARLTLEVDHLSKYVALLYQGRFRDVPLSHWAHDVIGFMAARQVIRGVSGDLFAPDAPVTRAQFATMLVRAFDLDRDPRFAYIFNDIDKRDPLAGEIGGAILSGLMMGYPDGNFRPEQLITRQELAIVLNRLAIMYQLPREHEAPDGYNRITLLLDWEQVAPWAKDATRAAIAQGWMTGRSDIIFAPEEITTRAEAATVVKRMIDTVAQWQAEQARLAQQ